MKFAQINENTTILEFTRAVIFGFKLSVQVQHTDMENILSIRRLRFLRLLISFLVVVLFYFASGALSKKWRQLQNCPLLEVWVLVGFEGDGAVGFDSEALRFLPSSAKFLGLGVFLDPQGVGSIHPEGLACNTSAWCETHLNETHGLPLILNTFSEVKHSLGCQWLSYQITVL